MHLESTRGQTVRVGDAEYSFAPGDTIHTENSHKYEIDEFAEMAATAGLRLARVWTDPESMFSVQLFWVDAA